MADALVSGTSEGNFMQVQVLLSAYKKVQALPLGGACTFLYQFINRTQNRKGSICETP